MFGHDDDQNNNNAPLTNLPDPAPDAHLANASEPLDSTLASTMNDTPGDFVATPLPGSDIQPASTPVGDSLPAAVPLTDPGATPASTDDLLSIKQQALHQLSPLVDHLEQSPEEHFRTTMMMIQASDNQALIKRAYEAALAIPDDKARAQALLDVINEINYFTQQQENSAPPAAA